MQPDQHLVHAEKLCCCIRDVHTYPALKTVAPVTLANVSVAIHERTLDFLDVAGQSVLSVNLDAICCVQLDSKVSTTERTYTLTLEISAPPGSVQGSAAPLPCASDGTCYLSFTAPARGLEALGLVDLLLSRADVVQGVSLWQLLTGAHGQGTCQSSFPDFWLQLVTAFNALLLQRLPLPWPHARRVYGATLHTGRSMATTLSVMYSLYLLVEQNPPLKTALISVLGRVNPALTRLWSSLAEWQLLVHVTLSPLLMKLAWITLAMGRGAVTVGRGLMALITVLLTMLKPFLSFLTPLAAFFWSLVALLAPVGRLLLHFSKVLSQSGTGLARGLYKLLWYATWPFVWLCGVLSSTLRAAMGLRWLGQVGAGARGLLSRLMQAGGAMIGRAGKLGAALVDLITRGRNFTGAVGRFMVITRKQWAEWFPIALQRLQEQLDLRGRIQRFSAHADATGKQVMQQAVVERVKALAVGASGKQAQVQVPDQPVPVVNTDAAQAVTAGGPVHVRSAGDGAKEHKGMRRRHKRGTQAHTAVLPHQ